MGSESVAQGSDIFHSGDFSIGVFRIQFAGNLDSLFSQLTYMYGGPPVISFSAQWST